MGGREGWRAKVRLEVARKFGVSEGVTKRLCSPVSVCACLLLVPPVVPAPPVSVRLFWRRHPAHAGGVDAPRGGAHRRGPHGCCVGGGHEAGLQANQARQQVVEAVL